MSGIMRVRSEQVEPLALSGKRVVQRSPRRLVAPAEEAAWKIDADEVRVCRGGLAEQVERAAVRRSDLEHGARASPLELSQQSRDLVADLHRRDPHALEVEPEGQIERPSRSWTRSRRSRGTRGQPP